LELEAPEKGKDEYYTKSLIDLVIRIIGCGGDFPKHSINAP
jgi:hypothetical protein